MYYDHFGLNQPPFRITPDQDFFYSGGNRGAILDALVYAVTSGEGIIKIVGEVGTGKTMLCRALESKLPDTIDIIYLPNPSLPHDEILYAIADELGLTHLADQKSTQIIREMQNHLIEKHAQGRQVVVFIDEAQAMPLDTLEQVRLLSNLETGSSKLLQIVLFGQPEFDQHINQPQIRQLKERITHSFHLHPFTRKEVDDYLIHRLRAAGYRGPHIFSQGAIRLIFKASQGLIRRVNILADKSLLAAFSGNTHGVTVKQVKAAIRDSSYTRQPRPSLMKLAIGLLLSASVLAIALWAIRERPSTAPQPESKPIAATQSKQPSIAGPRAEQAPTQAQAEAPQPEIAPSLQITASLANPNHRGEENSVPLQNALQARLDASSVLLKRQPGTYLTIQLMTVPPETVDIELERIQAQAKLTPEQIFIYPTTVKNKAAVSISTGTFPSTLEARAALVKFPEPILKNLPMLRTFKGIQDQIGNK